MNEIMARITDLAQTYLGLSPGVTERVAWTVVVLVAVRLVKSLFGVLIDRRIEDPTRRYTTGKTLGYILGFAGFMIVLTVWFGNVTGLAAYLGILSAGLAVALQVPLTNLAGWVFITIRKPFTVGDRIEIGGLRGDVVDVRLFQFTLMEIGNWVDADQSTGRIVHVPNGHVFRDSTANYTTGFHFIWNELPITVTFESDWRAAKEILTGLAEKHAILKSEEARNQVRQAARKYMIHFQYLSPIVWTSVADNGVTLTIRYICEARRRRSSAAAIWEDVLLAFAARDDIDFAYPTTRYYENPREGKPGARAD